MDVNSCSTKDYENKRRRGLRKNKANSLPDAKMNVSIYYTKVYNNEQRTMNNERLCKTNPIQSQ